MAVINWINGEGSGIWGRGWRKHFNGNRIAVPRGLGGGIMRELGGGTQLNMDEEKLS